MRVILRLAEEGKFLVAFAFILMGVVLRFFLFCGRGRVVGSSYLLWGAFRIGECLIWVGIFFLIQVIS